MKSPSPSPRGTTIKTAAVSSSNNDVSIRLAPGGAVLHRAPALPQEMQRFDVRVRYRDLRRMRDALTVRGHDGAAPPLTLCVDDEALDFVSGTTRAF